MDCRGRMAAAGLREEWYMVAIAYSMMCSSRVTQSLQWILGACMNGYLLMKEGKRKGELDDLQFK